MLTRIVQHTRWIFLTASMLCAFSLAVSTQTVEQTERPVNNPIKNKDRAGHLADLVSLSPNAIIQLLQREPGLLLEVNSKRICEMMIQSQPRREPGLFCCVRFGNVLGSRGSVVPIFQEQIQRGGPVTVTHQNAQRFLMTIPEAVCLLIQAGTLAESRDIFVLDMGTPVMIHKLAEDLIELSGLSPNRDIRIEITGLKRGEKLSEVLMDHTSELRATPVEKIKGITTRPFDVAAFSHRLRVLERAAWAGDAEEVYRVLAALNIGYASQVPMRAWPLSPARVVPVPAVGSTLASEMS